MKFIVVQVLACLSVIMLCSCASSERMMRLSPFNNNQTVKDNNSTVNLWPVWYNNEEYASALWPMIDSDAKGLAIRPFYNQDGKEYSILFPLFAWNPEKGDGWLLNTYWNNHSAGVIPLFHSSEEFSIIYPLLFWNIRHAPTTEDICRYNTYYFMFFFVYETQDNPENIIPALDLRIKQRDGKRKRNCQIVSDKHLELIVFTYSFNRYNTWICNQEKLSYLNWKLNQTIDNFHCLKSPGTDKKTADLIKTNAELKNEVAALLQELKIKTPTPENIEEINSLQNTLYNSYSKKIEQNVYSIPLLFYHETFDRDYKWNALFFIISGSQEEKKGEFSFLWRVYRSETDHGKTSGHIMFIPFGETKK